MAGRGSMHDMQGMADFLDARKRLYLKKAGFCERSIREIKRCIDKNERNFWSMGLPKAIIQDEHARERLCSEISRENAALAKVELIEELQEMFFGQMEGED